MGTPYSQPIIPTWWNIASRSEDVSCIIVNQVFWVFRDLLVTCGISIQMHNGDEKAKLAYDIFIDRLRRITCCLAQMPSSYSRNRWKRSKRSFFYYQWNQLVWAAKSTLKRTSLSCRRCFHRFPCEGIGDSNGWSYRWLRARWTFRKSVNRK